MADTQFTLRSNRMGAVVTLEGTVTSVAADADIAETFFLPAGLGDLVLSTVGIYTTELSGAYVAPAVEPCVQFRVISPDLLDFVDFLSVVRLSAVQNGTQLGFAAQAQMQRDVLMRRNDRIGVSLPELAGAGVTFNIVCFIRGVRIGSS